MDKDTQRLIIALNKLKPSGWEYGPVEGFEQDVVNFRGQLDDFEYRRFSFVCAQTELKCADILNDANTPEMHGVIEGFDLEKLEAMAAKEEKRMDDGPAAAYALTELTGVEWEWNGSNITTVNDVFTSPDYELMGEIKSIIEQGGVMTQTAVITHANGVYGSIDDWNIDILHQLVEQKRGEGQGQAEEEKGEIPRETAILQMLSTQFGIDFIPSVEGKSHGTLRMLSEQAFNAIPIVKNLNAQGVLTYEEPQPGEGKYYDLEITNLDFSRLQSFILNEEQRRENLNGICEEYDESLEYHVSKGLAEVTGLSNWFNKGGLISQYIPSGDNYVNLSHTIEELLDTKRSGSQATYEFLAVLAELAERGAITYHIDTDKPEVHITDANPELYEAAIRDPNLKKAAMERFTRQSLAAASQDKPDIDDQTLGHINKGKAPEIKK